MSTQAVTGEMAKLLAARLEDHGYLVTLLPGRDPAVFKVTGLPGGPYVEVSAEDNGQAACHYTDPDEAARVIARLPVPAASPNQAAAALLAHLAVLDGRSDRKDAPT